MDITGATEIHHKVREVVNIGACLLLPQLKERVQLLLQQLPLGSNLSQGQQMLLNIIITSLEEPTHIVSLLGYNIAAERVRVDDLYLTRKLLNTLLQTFNVYTVRECSILVFYCSFYHSNLTLFFK